METTRLSTLSSIVDHVCKQKSKDFSIGQQTQTPKKKKVRLSTTDVALRRERNRMHQARHKMKQKKKLVDLEESIQQLREEIQGLQVQRQLVASGIPVNKTVWSVAAEYFRLFRHGVRAPAPGMVALGTPCPPAASAQRTFLLTTMASDVAYGTVCGIEALLENWRLMTLYHEDIDVQLLRLDDGAHGTLIATSKGKIVITEQTLRYAFPNLLNDGKWSPLALKLLGQELTVIGTTCFYWNNQKGCVVNLEAKVDMMTPMLKLLGNLENISHVFDNALLTPDYEVVNNRDDQVPSIDW
ncbi:hypothetical protein PHYBOEH_005363 [Phytophthora boehmeriae]|uniref:BZIP domain-containing protein n=1 Tax=Phytophthora boehmeriae TaxID=109152 RepID=A0A8T1WPQ5_9STRA|nr:hypothetical protein PHYBOEH_005363 [Phytophthora boehmeriae]